MIKEEIDKNTYKMDGTQLAAFKEAQKLTNEQLGVEILKSTGITEKEIRNQFTKEELEEFNLADELYIDHKYWIIENDVKREVDRTQYREAIEKNDKLYDEYFETGNNLQAKSGEDEEIIPTLTEKRFSAVSITKFYYNYKDEPDRYRTTSKTTVSYPYSWSEASSIYNSGTTVASRSGNMFWTKYDRNTGTTHTGTKYYTPSDFTTASDQRGVVVNVGKPNSTISPYQTVLSWVITLQINGKISYPSLTTNCLVASEYVITQVPSSFTLSVGGFIGGSVGEIFIDSRNRSAGYIPAYVPYRWVKQDNGLWKYWNGGVWKISAWHQANSIWYYLKSDGYMAYSELEQVAGKWYWFKSNGYMANNEWVEVAGKWYWLKSGGAMAENEWLSYGGRWYWLKSSGAMASNEWLLNNGKWYWFKSSGVMAVNETVVINGKAYNFNSSGHCTNP